MDVIHVIDDDVAKPTVVVGAEVSKWCNSAGKRLLDLSCALLLVFVSLPLLLLITALVKLTSKGPVLFSQERVGKSATHFQLVKFRTMKNEARQCGPNLTRHGDTRITRVGRMLRKWKLDELPQLINVLRGDMSLVGPRPEIPDYFKRLAEDQQRVVSVRPGLTGVASVQYRNEEELLAQVSCERLEHFYLTWLLPKKIRLDMDYARDATLISDIRVLWLTLRAVAADQ
jgi:lipopolysaccharide/colanic/teichoic acid biosynthesis glycosyltransferase